MKIIALHTELAGYSLACLAALAEAGHTVNVVHWPIAREAPFEFQEKQSFTLIEKTHFSGSRQKLSRWIEKENANLVLISGWVDRDYIAAIRGLRGKGSRVILCFDNHWHGSIRQHFGTVVFRWRLRPSIDAAWIPGTPQVEFARRLGFSKVQYKTGYYCADTASFSGAGRPKFKPLSSDKLPRNRLIYIGRYAKSKGLRTLWTAFEGFAKNHPDWTLHCFGTGELWTERKVHAQIEHHGFIQPSELRQHIAGAAGFVMPSLKEPWGVVLHEMAAAGLPMIVSDAVGAASKFVQTGVNGWIYPAGDIEELTTALEKIRTVATSPNCWEKMSMKAQEKALKLTPEKWTEIAISFA